MTPISIILLKRSKWHTNWMFPENLENRPMVIVIASMSTPPYTSQYHLPVITWLIALHLLNKSNVLLSSYPSASIQNRTKTFGTDILFSLHFHAPSEQTNSSYSSSVWSHLSYLLFASSVETIMALKWNILFRCSVLARYNILLRHIPSL